MHSASAGATAFRICVLVCEQAGAHQIKMRNVLAVQIAQPLADVCCYRSSPASMHNFFRSLQIRTSDEQQQSAVGSYKVA